MRRNRGGFTILEVMIFLAISGVMLAAAMIAISGQQGRTQFIQAMRDIDSKLQDTMNDVSNGNFSYNGDNCTVVGDRPVLSGSGGEIGTRSDCLFLGEAIQFASSGSTGGVDNNTRFAVYTVLGRRLEPGAIAGTQVSVKSFNEASPTVMNASGHNLTNYYDFNNGITTKAIYYTPLGSASQTVGRSTLLGIYTSFTSAAANIGNTNADASQSLQAYTYSVADDGTSYGPNAKACIDANDPGVCFFDTSLSSGVSKGLGICFDSNNGTNQTALITIYNTSEGVSTRLEYNPDGGVC